MIKFLTLTIRNFLSYGNNTTKLKLDFTKPTLITGKNHDAIVEGQITSNGAGKSTILNAIAYCLYDKTISNIALDDLVNYLNNKNMEVSVTFSKDDIVYVVERYRKNKVKGGNGIKILENGVDITPAGSGEANKKLADIIGIPFEIFSRIVVFVASYEPFLSLPASHASKANQRDIIEELFGLVELSEKAEKLKAEITKTKQSLNALIAKNDRIVNERDRQTAQIVSASTKKDAWDEEYATNISTIRAKIKTYTSLDFDVIESLLDELDELVKLRDDKVQQLKLLQMQLDAITTNNKSFYDWTRAKESTVDKLNTELLELNSIDVEHLKTVKESLERLTTAISEHKKTEKQIRTQYTTAEASLGKLKDEIAQLHSNLCPYCKQTYTDSLDKLNSCKEHITTVEDDTTRLYQELSDVVASRKKLEEEIEQYLDVEIPPNLQSIETLIIKKSSELETITKQTNPFELKSTMDVEGTIMDTTDEISDVRLKLEGVNKKLNILSPQVYGVDSWNRSNLQRVNSTIDQLADKLKELKKTKNPFVEVLVELYDTLDNIIEKVDTDAVDALAVLLEHQEFLLKLLTKKDSFVRKALLNKNIPFLNARLSHYLSLIGLPHKVLFNEEMGATITQFGTVYEFENLSSGQKARINLALSFSFRDVLQARFSRINFCILDECLDVGLDNVGISLAAKMIKAIAVNEKLSMLVISHRDEVANMFDKKLEVELKDGFSNILPGDLLIEEEE